jgi:hypothetical protein
VENRTKSWIGRKSRDGAGEALRFKFSDRISIVESTTYDNHQFLVLDVLLDAFVGMDAWTMFSERSNSRSTSRCQNVDASK